MNPRITLAMNMALEKVKAGVTVRQAAADTGLWPQSVYVAIKREGIKVPAAKKRKPARVAG